jgi:hypothetical protein
MVDIEVKEERLLDTGNDLIPAVVEIEIKNQIILIKGDPGKSAYELAVENGFEGSESEWLDSLKNSATAKIGYVTILADAWDGTKSPFIQVVEVEGAEITVNSQVDLTPDGDMLEVWRSKELGFVAENHGGTVIVKAVGQKPQKDYTIQVTVTEVSR